MANGTVAAICISPVAGGPMQQVEEVEAITGAGLKGDRYCTGEGSFNRKKSRWWKLPFIKKFLRQKRQITIINSIFFEGSGFEYIDSRRNLVIHNIELMWLIGREFQIGTAHFRGVKYCDPCERPRKLSGKERSFKKAFFDRGGLIAEVTKSGIIRVGDSVIPPPKGY